MAQLDRATVCGTVGRRFESCWAHSFFLCYQPSSNSYLSQFIEVIVFEGFYNLGFLVFSKSKNRLFFE